MSYFNDSTTSLSPFLIVAHRNNALTERNSIQLLRIDKVRWKSAQLVNNATREQCPDWHELKRCHSCERTSDEYFGARIRFAKARWYSQEFRLSFVTIFHLRIIKSATPTPKLLRLVRNCPQDDAAVNHCLASTSHNFGTSSISLDSEANWIFSELRQANYWFRGFRFNIRFYWLRIFTVAHFTSSEQWWWHLQDLFFLQFLFLVWTRKNLEWKKLSEHLKSKTSPCLSSW